MRIHKTHIIEPEMIGSGQLSLFVVGKDDVENLFFERFDRSEANLRAAKRRAAGSISIAFDYDDDPRELYAIPEVVIYTKELFIRCPYLLYFIIPDPETLRSLALCAMDAVFLSASGGSAKIGFSNAEHSKTVLKTLLDYASEYSWRIGDKNTPLALRGALSRADLL